MKLPWSYLEKFGRPLAFDVEMPPMQIGRALEWPGGFSPRQPIRWAGAALVLIGESRQPAQRRRRALAGSSRSFMHLPMRIDRRILIFPTFLKPENVFARGTSSGATAINSITSVRAGSRLESWHG